MTPFSHRTIHIQTARPDIQARQHLHYHNRFMHRMMVVTYTGNFR